MTAVLVTLPVTRPDVVCLVLHDVQVTHLPTSFVSRNFPIVTNLALILKLLLTKLRGSRIKWNSAYANL